MMSFHGDSVLDFSCPKQKSLPVVPHKAVAEVSRIGNV